MKILLVSDSHGYDDELKKVLTSNGVSEVSINCWIESGIKEIEIKNKTIYFIKSWSRFFPFNCNITNSIRQYINYTWP